MSYKLSHLNFPESLQRIAELSSQTVNADGCTLTLQAIPAGPSKSGPGYHRHPEEQVIIILQGELDVLLTNETIRMTAGDVLAIGSNEIHGAARVNGGAVLMLNVFAPRRPDTFTHAEMKTFDRISDVP